MKILITGGAGFVGGNIAISLAGSGHDVTCLDNLVRRGSEFNVHRFYNHNNINFIHGDIRCAEDLAGLGVSPDIVLECSAQTTAVDGYTNPSFDFTNNTVGLVNVLEFCRKKRAGLIFWSTNKVYSGDICNSPPIFENETRLEWDNTENFQMPGWSCEGFSEKIDLNGGNHTIYGVTKSTSDLLCQEWSSAFDIPVIINRFSCLYGPNQFGMVSQGWVMWLMLAKLLELPLAYYGFAGKQVRDCLYIDDVIRLIKLQIDNIHNHRGSYYNVGGGRKNSTSIRELNDRLDLMLGITSDVVHKAPRRADQKIFISDNTKVMKNFDWRPEVDLDEGLSLTLEWAISNADKFRWLKEK